jgi:chemosensory pili system protein ChpA (sensor histidine kinase/response regulator)
MQVNETEIDLATNDLGPLAWVLDELRKSLDSASAALRRFVRDTGLARGTDMASVDGGQLRIARQQLHQAVGALEMVGLGAPAHMLRSMEAAVQTFIERPELCNEASSAKVERAGFALTEYLEGVLLGKPASAVALFPQYREVQELSGADRIHPADLWMLEWRWNDPRTPAVAEALVYDPAVRSRLDQAVLKVMKAADAEAARELGRVSLSLAATQTARQPSIFWKLCAAYFEAISLKLLPSDIYVKRVGSRILQQYASLAKGELGVSDRLAQDLLFFCSQAAPAHPADAPALTAVRLAWNLERCKPVDYQVPQFGRFDPVLLSQSRKRIGAAKETWSALSGGDANKLKGLSDQFQLVTDSLLKLHPPSGPLAQALTSVIDSVIRSGRPPGAELAMEVATAVLYLEAAFEDLDPSDSQLAVRTAHLAERLDKVRQGGQPEPLEPWMEELYRRVSDRQTMGSVVGELRGTLGELEKLLDQFFRDLQDKTPLRDAPGHFAQMRGVLSVLGLDQAAQAVSRMRESVEEIIVTEIDEERARATGTFDKLGNNMGALGLLIDMLNYQPTLAKKLFVYDDTTGELRPLMGRTGHAVSEPHSDLDESPREVQAVASAAAVAGPQAEPASPAPSAQPARADKAAEPAAPAKVALATAAQPSPIPVVVKPASVPTPVMAVPVAVSEPDNEEDELLDIFLEEAREVVVNGLTAIAALEVNPGDLSELTTLRRAFHTLKGSSRMVGLNEFGEAAWSLEQVLNTCLADQKPGGDELRALTGDAMRGFSRWVDDIAAHADGEWKASAFRGPADTFRTEGKLVPITLPDAAAAVDAAPAESPAEVLAIADDVLSFDIPVEVTSIEISEDAAPALSTEIPPTAEPVVIELSVPESEAATADTTAVVESGPPPLEFDLDLPAPTGQTAQSALPRAMETPAPVPEFDFSIADSSFATGIGSQERAPVTEAVEIDGIDFASLPALSASPEPELEVPKAVEEIDFFDLSAVEPVVSIVPAQEEEPVDSIEPALVQEPAPSAFDEAIELPNTADTFDQVKVIGSLRIGIPLYNVYLNEADEWSRRLANEVAEWVLEMDQPVTDSMVGLAHALAGSSATVGFNTLSDIARALENSLEQTQSLAYCTRQHGAAFTGAAEEIRRLLHQFAAGFLKESNPGVIEALNALKDLEIPLRADMPEDEPLSGFADLGPVPDIPLEFLDSQRSAEPEQVVTPLVEAGQLPIEALESATVAPEPVDLARGSIAIAPASAQTLVLTAPAIAPAPAVVSPINVLLSGDFSDEEDEIDVLDAIDPDLFAIFEEEAIELMPQLGGALRQWTARPENRAARDEVLRVLHTLKGSARLAGALRLGELSHRLESEIERMGSGTPTAADIDPLLHRFDGMQANFDNLRAGVSAHEAAGTVPQPALQPEAEQPQAPSVAPPALLAPPAEEAGQPPLVSARALLAKPATTNMASQRAVANHAVRVRSQLLDRLVNQAGEVMITRSRLEAELRQLRSSLTDLTGNLDRLRSQLRDIELQAESQMQSRLAQAKDSAAGFDPLEFDRFTRVQELTRMMAESVNDVATVQRNLQRTVESTEDDLIAQARQTRELQRDLLRTRMVEFEGISDRLYRVIRLASKETGKQVKLDITGGSIEMDRGVLDRMTPAFEHLLRNCVAHGIEMPATREAAGKDPIGTIVIGLHHEGNDVSVEFRDDGAGLDLPRIREKALQQGLITASQELLDSDAANLIFLPGFSTASQVTELSGRGIGMDVVRAEVNALGGRIETTTVRDKGTSFKLVLPLTTAVTQVVMIRSGNLSIGVPANLVEIVRRAPAKDVQLAYNTGEYEVGAEKLPFYWSGALLQASQRSSEPQSKTLPVVVFRSAAQRIAVHVDEVLGNQEVVVKNLGPQLARLPGLAGMTVLASGAVVLIYNPVALTTVYGEQARHLSADRAQPDVLGQAGNSEAPLAPMAPLIPVAPQIPLVLVVDDSITVRRVTQRLLQREGYRVSMAADGLQALERLAEEKPTVVVSDIEMPRMDGFDLARNIRADDRLKDLPIIMITSRIGEKHREHAKELGVDHYLGKPYSEEELLSLVKHYSQAALLA